MKPYGKELILDLHNCSIEKFNREGLKQFFIELCGLIDMKREELYFWDYVGDVKGYKKAPAHLKGTSAIQFISTSNITIHTLDEMKRIYLNIFSCKDFNFIQAAEFGAKFFSGQVVRWKGISRL